MRVHVRLLSELGVGVGVGVHMRECMRARASALIAYFNALASHLESINAAPVSFGAGLPTRGQRA